MRDRSTLVKVGAMVSEVYGRVITDAGFSIWWNTLLEYPDEMVVEAVLRHLADPERGRFFPTPADVISHCRDLRRERRLEASAPALSSPKQPPAAWVMNFLVGMREHQRKFPARGSDDEKKAWGELMDRTRREREAHGGKNG